MTFEAIGTTWQIDLFTDLSLEQQQLLFKKIRHNIEVFDQCYSRFRADSLVSQMAKLAGEYILPKDAKKMLDFYTDLNWLSKGLFTPCVGQLLSDAGYDEKYSLQAKKQLATPNDWKKINYTGEKISLQTPVLLDFGAAGKGYLLDLLAKLLQQEGINEFCLDAGGDLLHYTQTGKNLRVGLENPLNPQQVLGVFELSHGSLAASSGNRRKWGKFHHIINPLTNSSPTEILATWVNAAEAMVADGLATALFLVDPKQLTSQYNFDYLILYKNYSISKSTNFRAQLFS